ncbi:MAG: DNA (cytosine-5-)-methyltransferase [Pirellulales bacterium]|nr:DNA (cytosine-5-)-methyltransferase [Pirellulales bacterium]
MTRIRNLKFVDLFAGVGGFHLGLSRLGHRCVFACEKDERLRAIYRQNFKLDPSGDIRDVELRDIPSHDVLCAGFPCQPFSKAGEQLGFSCQRDGDLFDEILRILSKHRPRWIILENVANLLRHDSGDTYRWMKEELESLRYTISEKVLSPHQFGIPQIRERAFIVGAINGLGRFDWPAPLDAVPDIRSVLDRKPREARLLPEHYMECLEVWQEFLDRIPADEPLPSFPIWAFEFGATYPYEGKPPLCRDPRYLARTLGSFGQPLSGLSESERRERLPSYARGAAPFPRWKQTFIAQNREFFEKHRKRLKTWLPKLLPFSPSLQKLEWNCKGEVRRLDSHVLQFRASGVRVKRSNWAPALVAMTTTQVPVIPWEQRYMTVRECSRLQGLGKIDLSPLNSTSGYRAIGNAVSADLVEAIGRKLLRAPTTTRKRDRKCPRLAAT